MMMNLFNMLDTKTLLTQNNYLNMTLFMQLLYMKMISSNNLKKMKLMIINNYINPNNKTMMQLINSLTMIILISNILNLMPFNQSLTLNTINILMFTLNIWVTSLMIVMKNKNLILLMNMTPKNTDMKLTWIINLIELNSFFFQILSLTLRLSINMIMGHTIMTLTNNTLSILIYMPLETMIILIQTYIFITLQLLNLNNMI